MGNDIVARTIRSKFHNDKEYLKNLHVRIADVMSRGVVSIRTLEELTNHYFKAQIFFALKQTIASIDTFLLLFNPYTKYDLCRYWQVLEAAGYDPVVEYNKGLELFDMHFSPKPEDLFTIILQISRFLKEFSDFETKNTPQFRHPPIKGKIVKEKEKVIREDSLFGDESQRSTPKANQEQSQKKGKGKGKGKRTEMKFDVMAFLTTYSEEAKQYVEKEKNRSNRASDLPFVEDDEIMDELELKKEKEKKVDGMISYLDDIGLEREIKYMNMTEDLYGKVLQDHELFNVDVPSGKVTQKSL